MAEDEDCMICLSSLKNPRVLPCDHEFHKVCINKWLNEKLECPVCRLELPLSYRVCGLCLSPVNEKRRRATLLCTHTFHVDCLNQQLLHRQQCPTCHVSISLVLPSERTALVVSFEEHQPRVYGTMSSEPVLVRNQRRDLMQGLAVCMGFSLLFVFIILLVWLNNT